MDSGPPGQHIHLGEVGGGGVPVESPSVEIAIAFLVELCKGLNFRP